MNLLRRGVAVAVIAVAFAATPAIALAPVVTNTKDASPSVVTRPALASPRQVVKVRENAMTPSTPVRLKVYPDTSGFQPTSSHCQGKYMTPYRKTGSNGKVVIALNPRKPLCAGILYQAEALIGHGDVADKFAHICVRGRPSAGSTGCQDNPYY